MVMTGVMPLQGGLGLFSGSLIGLLGLVGGGGSRARDRGWRDFRIPRDRRRIPDRAGSFIGDRHADPERDRVVALSRHRIRADDCHQLRGVRPRRLSPCRSLHYRCVLGGVVGARSAKALAERRGDLNTVFAALSLRSPFTCWCAVSSFSEGHREVCPPIERSSQQSSVQTVPLARTTP